MVSISSAATYKSIDVPETMRPLVDELVEIVNRFQLDESRKLVRSLQALQKRIALPQVKLAILSDSQDRKDMLIQTLLRISLKTFPFPPRDTTCLYLAYGSEPECAVTLANGMTARLPIEELPEFVRNNGPASNFKKFLIRIPNEVLKAGVMVIDTPTLVTAAQGAGPSTQIALQEADACLLLLNTSEKISRSVDSFLQTAHSHLAKFFVLLEDPSPDRDSSLRRALEAHGGIVQSRIVSLPPSVFHQEGDFSGEDGLASFRSELMQFSHINAYKAMAGEFHTLAVETLAQADRAASGRTLVQRAKLRLTVRHITRICERSEELLEQTTAEVARTAESQDLVRDQESDAPREEAVVAPVVAVVEVPVEPVATPIVAAAAAPVEATSAPILPIVEAPVEAAPAPAIAVAEVPAVHADEPSPQLPVASQPVNSERASEPAVKPPIPEWQHSLRRASKFEPAKAAPVPSAQPHSPSQEQIQRPGGFARTTNTRDAAALFARQSFTAGTHLVTPAGSAEPAFRAGRSTARATATQPAPTASVVMEPSAPLIEQPAEESSAETAPLIAELAEPSTPAITIQEEHPAITAPPYRDASELTVAPAKRSSWDELEATSAPSASQEFHSLSSYGANAGRSDDASHSTSGHIAWRVAAVVALAASALVVTLGLQRHQHSQAAPKAAIASTSLSQPGNGQSTAANNVPEQKSSSPAIPAKAPSLSGPRSNADTRAMTGVSTPSEALHGKDEASAAHSAGLAAGTTDARTQPSSPVQSESGSTLKGGESVTDPSLRLAIERWASSYRKGNAQDQAACYAPFVDTFFDQKNVRPDQVARDRKNEWSKIASVQEYRVTPLRVTDQGNGQQAVLLQKDWNTTTTRGTHFSGSDLEKLVFVKIDNSWKIVEEQEVKVLKPKRG